jgi:N-acetylglutamate synthase-like GNAT family acetyltransferase
MLMPSMPAECHAVVALDGTQGLVVGAAAITHSRRSQPVVGPGAMIHVIPPCRGHGIAAALCTSLVEIARNQRAQAIYSAQRVEFDSPEMAAWQRLGFEVCETVEEHELSLAQFTPRLSPLVEWLRSRGYIPADARIAPLYAANHAKVLQLHLDELGGDRASLYTRIRGQGPNAFHPRYSRVLTVGDRTVGCILAHRKSQHVAAVDANIIRPEYRNGWANAWLKLEATQGAMSLGITHFHFTSFDQYADTRTFAGKLGGVTTKKWALMYRRVD